MKDFDLTDIGGVLVCLNYSDAEDLGYADELVTYDFSDENQAREAIRRWVLDDFKFSFRTDSAVERLKVALRVAMSVWGFYPAGPSLNGVEDSDYPKIRQFYLWLWDELFHEPFQSLENLSDYEQERCDVDFANALNREPPPNPKYRGIEYYDELIVAYGLPPARLSQCA